jgi:hypothetical protein
MKPIPQEKWKWFGMPGHFIASESCVHHLCTVIGKHMISTVGDYRPRSNPNRDRETIGANRFFETFVFKITKGRCGCGCGIPKIIPSEIDALPANTAMAADRNHMKLCRKYAKR